MGTKFIQQTRWLKRKKMWDLLKIKKWLLFNKRRIK